ncbi:MAG: ABC transporter permease [Verrucomicrobia bacterium]|nr:ABC transporter permease [Verrucomicrobiota bacterium]
MRGPLGFFRITGSELRRMFARPRTYLGYAAFFLFNVLFLLLMSRPGPSRLFRLPLERAGYLFEDYFSALTLAYSMVALTTVFLATLFFPLVAGDIVAKEVEDGNLRLLLSRPVSRFHLLLSKFIACQLYTVTLVLFIGLISLVTGGFLARWNGGLFAFAPERGLFATFPFAAGLVRFALALLCVAASMGTVTSVAFFFSCQRMKPAAATILTVCLFFIDAIFSRVPYFAEYEDWFLTSRMAAWLDAFRERVPVHELLQNYAILAGISLTCFVLGWAVFERRDLKA